MKKLFVGIFCTLCFLWLIGCAQEKLPYEYDNERKVGSFDVLESADIPANMNVPWRVRDSMSIAIWVGWLREYGMASVLRYNDEHYYSINPLNDGRYLMILFERMGENDERLYVVDSYIASELTDRTSFDEAVKVGTKMEDVLAADENAVIFADESYHRFSDKTVVVIAYSYDESMQTQKVSQIWEVETDKSVLSYLLSNDFSVLVE